MRPRPHRGQGWREGGGYFPKKVFYRGKKSKTIRDFSGTVFYRRQDRNENFKNPILFLPVKQAPFYSCEVMCTRENGNEAGESQGQERESQDPEGIERGEKISPLR